MKYDDIKIQKRFSVLAYEVLYYSLNTLSNLINIEALFRPNVRLKYMKMKLSAFA